MAKFNPTVFGLTVIIIAGTIFGLLAITNTDGAIGLEILPPELRVVGGCFRDCLDEEQTGFGTLDCPTGTIAQLGVCVEQTQDVEAMLSVTDEEGNVTLEPVIIKPDGTIVKIDEVTGEEVPIVEPDPTNQCSGDKELVDGECVDLAVTTQNGQTHSVIDLQDPIACWLEVTTEILDNNGNVIGTEKAGFFKTLPVPQLSLTDVPTGKNIDEQGGFNVMPMLKCSTKEIGGLSTTADPFFTIFGIVYPSFDIPLTLESTELVARVWSVSPEGNTLVDTFNFPLDIDRLEITSADAMTLGELKIPSERILVFLPDGMYDSIQHIVLDGTLVLHWNTGNDEIDKVNYPITLQTNVIRNPLGQVVSVENPLTITREIAVEKNVGEEEIPEKPDCKPNEVAQGQLCVEVGNGEGCEPDEVFVSGLGCVGKGEDPNVDPNILDKFLACIESGADGCLLGSEFIPFYIVGVGALVFIGAISQRSQPQIYGVPRGGF